MTSTKREKLQLIINSTIIEHYHLKKKPKLKKILVKNIYQNKKFEPEREFP